MGQLARAVNLNSLHLEVIVEDALLGSNTSSNSGGAMPGSPTAAVATAAAVSLAASSRSPSELARLQGSDEVGLAKLGTQLTSLTAIGLSGASMQRPITSLLAAVAGSHRPRLAQLQLGAQEVPAQSLDLIAAITSLQVLRLLPGCDLPASSMDLMRLSALSGLTELQVLPCMPPSPVLLALTGNGKKLSKVALCAQPGPQPIAPPMAGVTELQLLSISAARRAQVYSSSSSSSKGGCDGSLDGGYSSSVGAFTNLAITLKSPLSLSGIELLWPNLAFLEVRKGCAAHG